MQDIKHSKYILTTQKWNLIEDEIWDSVVEEVEGNRDIVPVEEVEATLYKAEEVPAFVSKQIIAWPSFKISESATSLSMDVGALLGKSIAWSVHVMMQAAGILVYFVCGILWGAVVHIFSGDGLDDVYMDDNPRVHRRGKRCTPRSAGGVHKKTTINVNPTINVYQND